MHRPHSSVVDIGAASDRARRGEPRRGCPRPTRDAGSSTREDSDPQTGESPLCEILSQLRFQTRHDFRHYKRATVLRRIERRLQVNRVADLPATATTCASNPKEAAPLLQDMLISVTNFFRDREAFEALEREVAAGAVRGNPPASRLRVWVAGCATRRGGLFARDAAAARHARTPHATRRIPGLRDRHRRTRAARSRGRRCTRGDRRRRAAGAAAPASSCSEDGPLPRHASRCASRCCSRTHNVLRDPPFSRLDLICCRNLLIYLDAAPRPRVLEMFRFALKPGGFAVPRHVRIGRRGRRPVHAGRQEAPHLPGQSGARVRAAARRCCQRPASPLTRGVAAPVRPTTAGSARRRCTTLRTSARLRQHVAAERAGRRRTTRSLHLSHRRGRVPAAAATACPSHNLLDNVHPDLRLELRTALFKADADRRSLSEHATRGQRGRADERVRHRRAAGAATREDGAHARCWSSSTSSSAPACRHAAEDARPATRSQRSVRPARSREPASFRQQLQDDASSTRRDLDRGAEGIQRGIAGDQRGAALRHRGARDQQGRARSR